MATAEEFIIRLQFQVDGKADTNKALNALEAQIRREQSALDDLAKKSVEIESKISATQGTKNVKSFEAALKQKEKLSEQTTKRMSAVEALEQARGLASKADAGQVERKAATLRQLAMAARQAGGPLGDVLSAWDKISKGGAETKIIATQAAFIGLYAAALVAAVALTRFAASSADAARSQRLLNEAAAGGSEKLGAELTMVIGEVARQTPLAKDRIAEMGRALELAGYSGRRMQLALLAVTTLESATGKGGALQSIIEDWTKLSTMSASQGGGFRAFATLTDQQLRGTGLRIRDVAKELATMTGMTEKAAQTALARGTAGVDKTLQALQNAVQSKFGGIIDRQMKGLATQFDKMGENIRHLFSDVNIDPFLDKLKQLTDMFSTNTYSGYALKEAVTTLFNELSKLAGGAGVNSLQDAFDSVTLAIVEAEIEYFKLKKIFTEPFNISNLANFVGKMSESALAITPGYYAGFLEKYIARAYNRLNSARGIGGPGGSSVGASIGDGIIDGMKAKEGEVEKAGEAMGAAGVRGANRGAGVKSPSWKTKETAHHMAEGYVIQAEKEAPRVEESMSKMLSPEKPDSKNGGPKMGGGSPRTWNVNITKDGQPLTFDEFWQQFLQRVDEEERGGNP